MAHVPHDAEQEACEDEEVVLERARSWWTITSHDWFDQPQHLVDYICAHSAQLVYDEPPYDERKYDELFRIQCASVRRDRDTKRTTRAMRDEVSRSPHGLRLSSLKSVATTGHWRDMSQLQSACRENGWCIVTPTNKRKYDVVDASWIIDVRHAPSIMKRDSRTLRYILRHGGMMYGTEERMRTLIMSQWTAFQLRSFNALIIPTIVAQLRSAAERSNSPERDELYRLATRYTSTRMPSAECVDNSRKSRDPLALIMHVLMNGDHAAIMSLSRRLQTYVVWWMSMFQVGRDWPSRTRRHVKSLIYSSLR